MTAGDAPRVSIVIPTFNRAAYVCQAIDTALAQTETCRVIVADHGSTDDTPTVLASYGDRVTYVRRERDFGPHFCWLEGVLHAETPYVHLQFDDDWLEPTYVEACMAQMSDETGFVFSTVALHDEEAGAVTGRLFEGIYPATGVHPRAPVEKILMRKLISPGALICRKQDLQDALYQGDLPLAEATYHGVGPDLFVALLCLLRYPKVGYVAEPLAVFRAHETSITMDAQKHPGRDARLKAAYDEVRKHYRHLKRARRRDAILRRLRPGGRAPS